MSVLPSVRCPSCSNPVSIDGLTCPNCNNSLPRRDGILSFADDPVSSNNRSESQSIARIAELIQHGSSRAVSNEIIGEHSSARQLLREIYDTRIDAWRILVEDHLDGRCLDLYTGWGRRSLALAELVDSVCAVDPDLAKMRALNARDDYNSASKVVPIHATETPPFHRNTFDTIVADFTGRSERMTWDRIETLDSLSTADASILVVIDGIPRKLGVSGLLGLDESNPSVSLNSFRSTTNRCRRFLESLGYEAVQSFVLWPTIEELKLIFEERNPWGYPYLVDSVSTAKRTRSWYPTLLRAANRMNLLEHCMPNVLVVGSDGAHKSTQSCGQPVLATGRSRSTLFEHDGELSNVQKVPNRLRHSKYNERENELIQRLRTREPQIRDYLPDGKLIESPFGSVRMERPVEGKPISELIDESPESREETLSIGLQWLIGFQEPHRRKRVSIRPRDLVERSELKLRRLDLSQLPKSIELFETPVHGDFLPENIYVEHGDITTVIDWEYGCFRGNPIVDVGFFVARVIAYERVPVTEAMLEVRNRTSPFGEVGWNAVAKYCDTCDIDADKVLSILPVVYLHRVDIDAGIDGTSRYTAKEQERLARAEAYWEDIAQ